jgi:DNA-binding NtrC family response regulator
MSPRQILIVEDEHALGKAIEFAVRRTGHLPMLAASGAAAVTHASKERVDAAIVDIGLPDMSGLDLIQKLRATHSGLPVLVITAHGTLEHAIAARKNGATDYLVKPLDLKQLETTLHAMLAGQSEPAAPRRTQEKGRTASSTVSDVLVGTALCLRAVFEGISRACVSDESALITGPSGSGKTLAARVIHANGKNKGESLLEVECGALTTLDELSKLKKGSVLLKEVADLSPALQRQIAAALNEANGPRWMATSRQAPAEAMREGTLRPELYYALSALHLDMPPLQQRTSDVPALAAHFQPEVEISTAAMATMQAYDWPGNVRELQHVLNLAVGLAGAEKVILPSHLPPHLVYASEAKAGPVMPAEVQAVIGRWVDSTLAAMEEETRNYDQLLDSLEALLLQHLLQRHDEKPTYLASALRMNRTTLRQKMRRLGIVGEEG